MTILFAAIRWLHEASLMAIFGGAMLLALLRMRLPVRWRVLAAAIALVSALIWLGLAGAQMAGYFTAISNPTIIMITLTQTLFGQVFVARALLLILLCASLILKWPESLIAILSGGALALIAVTSHAADASPAHFTAIGIVSDGLHLLTGGFWIGGLAMLASIYTFRRANFPAALTLFAGWGMAAVSVLLLTGMLNATTILLGGEGHDTGGYLAVLGAKLALVLAMVALALVNHFRLLPGVAQGEAAQKLFGNIRLEFGLGLAVVALAALLGLLPPTL